MATEHVTAERLRALVWIESLDDQSRATFHRLNRALQLWHAARGTRERERVANRQMRVALCLVDGDTREQVAERLGVEVRTVRRDIEVLAKLMEPPSAGHRSISP
jgi:DNA-binding NarL/FixJ family response regulator